MNRLLVPLLLSTPIHAAQELTDEQYLCLFKGDAAYTTQAIRNRVPADDWAIFEHNAKMEVPDTKARDIRLHVSKRVFQLFTPNMNPFVVTELIIEDCMQQNKRIEAGLEFEL